MTLPPLPGAPENDEAPIGGVPSAPIKAPSVPIPSFLPIPDALVSGGNIEERLEFLWKVHGYTNDYIRFADTKAGLIAGTVLAVIGAIVAAHPFDSISETPIGQQHYRVWFAAAAVGILVTSFVSAILAIRPRLKSDIPKGFIFLGKRGSSPIGYGVRARM